MTDFADRMPIGKAGRRFGSSALDRTDSDRPADAISPDDIDRELARSTWFRLGFPPFMEARYEADTKLARVRHISLVISSGLVFYLAGVLIDHAMFPDLGHITLIVRLVMVPLIFFAIWVLPRVGAVFRNGYVTFMVAVVILSPLAFMTASRAPLASYTIIIVFLTSIVGQVMLRIQFAWTWILAVATAAGVGGMLYIRTDFPPMLGAFFWLNTFITCSYGMMICNLLERAERRGYLLTLREQVRSEQLSRDKQELSVLTLEDPLTGVANRRAFDTGLATLMKQAESQASPFSMLMIDVDYFKLFNDHYGHPAGDACLQRVSHALKDIVLRKQDLLARYGGEEFAVLLVGCGTKDAADFAKRLRLSVFDAKIPHDHRGDDIPYVTVSIGVASLDSLPRHATASDLVARADDNLYAAKRLGRNRIIAGDAP